MEKLRSKMWDHTELLLAQLHQANIDAERLRQIECGEIKVSQSEIRRLRKRVLPLIERSQVAADLAAAMASLAPPGSAAKKGRSN